MQLGASRSTVMLTDRVSWVTFSDSAWSPFGGLGAGIDLEANLGRYVSLGFLAEGGYILNLGPEYEFTPEDGAADDAIEIRNASMGELSRSGAYLRVAGLLRF